MYATYAMSIYMYMSFIVTPTHIQLLSRFDRQGASRSRGPRNLASADALGAQIPHHAGHVAARGASNPSPPPTLTSF